MAEQYTYAVARIRAKELALLSRQDVEQLMACRDYAECLRTLADKGWGTGADASTEIMLAAEQEKTWALMREMVGNLSVFRVFLWPVDFGNLKAAIKAVLTDAPQERLFAAGGTIAPQVFVEAVRQNDFSALPQEMQTPAREAYYALLQARDGQLCDVILDRAALCAILEAGKTSGSEMLSEYAEMTVAVADIKIAVRGGKTKKNAEFFKRSMAPCTTLNVGALATAAEKGPEELHAYLLNTQYAGAAEALRVSASAFEKWCGDVIMTMIRGQKSNPFTVGPLAAYVLARENEVRTVRILLSGKLNKLSDSEIRERLGEMYV